MLCSHLKIAPSCRRFPPQTRGEHLWCRSTGDASAAWRGGCFHGTHTNKSHFYTSPCPGGATAAGWHLDFRDPQECPCHPSQEIPHAAPCPRSAGSRGVLAGSSRACRETCAGDSYEWRNLGRVYNYMYCFFLCCPATKTLHLSRIHPPHLLSIRYFLLLHLPFDKTLSKVLFLNIDIYFSVKY